MRGVGGGGWGSGGVGWGVSWGSKKLMSISGKTMAFWEGLPNRLISTSDWPVLSHIDFSSWKEAKKGGGGF